MKVLRCGQVSTYPTAPSLACTKVLFCQGMPGILPLLTVLTVLTFFCLHTHNIRAGSSGTRKRKVEYCRRSSGAVHPPDNGRNESAASWPREHAVSAVHTRAIFRLACTTPTRPAASYILDIQHLLRTYVVVAHTTSR